MITPNKLTPLDKSVLGKLEVVLRALDGETPIRELYRDVTSKFDSVDDFLLALDVLYLLGAINVNLNEAVISNAS